MYRSRTLAVAMTAVFISSLVYAQDKAADIDKVFSWATPATPGCAVALSQHGKLVVRRAYGLADVERKVPITPDTVFDVGSVVKQFVAAATLLLVEDGRLSLTEDVRKYIPELPDYGHKITLDHLMTHTGGIRDWDGLTGLTDGKTDALTLTLRQRGLNFTPGAEWAYSNSGYVLLKEIVARTSGVPFGEFARRRLFAPLGMKSTAYVRDAASIKDAARAYERAGAGWKETMLLGNARGGGGALLSTAPDLVIWNDALTGGRLGKFVTAKIQEPAALANGRTLAYARGLYLDTTSRGKLVWHAGSAGAYKSVVGRIPEHGLSVAIACNAGEAADARTRFAARIFDLFVPVTRAPESNAPPAAATVEGVDLTGKAGLFFNERTGQPLRLAVESGRLRVQGGPLLDVVAADRFRNPGGMLSFMSQDAFELHFLSADAFELKSMEGSTTRYRRAQPGAPAEADLQALGGRYQSDEIGAFFDIVPAKDGLLGRANDAPGPALPFRMVDRDTFQLSGVILRFRRDNSGKVVAVDYSNPVNRNITFTRVTAQQPPKTSLGSDPNGNPLRLAVKTGRARNNRTTAALSVRSE